MNELKAKLEALLLGIKDPQMIDNAEQLVKAAVDISTASAVSFGDVFEALYEMVQMQQTEVAQAAGVQPGDILNTLPIVLPGDIPAGPYCNEPGAYRCKGIGYFEKKVGFSTVLSDFFCRKFGPILETVSTKQFRKCAQCLDLPTKTQPHNHAAEKNALLARRVDDLLEALTGYTMCEPGTCAQCDPIYDAVEAVEDLL